MNRKTSKWLITLLAASSIGTAAAVLADPPAAGFGCHRTPHAAMFQGRHDSEQRIERMADRLNVTPEQRTAMRGVVDKYRPELRALADRMRTNRQELRTLQRQDQPDANRLHQLADAQGQALSQTIVLRSEMRSAIHQVLTPEQREQLQQMRGKWSPRG